MREYFRVDPESNRIDRRAAKDQTSCCVVNLAFAGLEGFGFFCRLWPLRGRGVSASCEVVPKMEQEEYFRVKGEWICMG